MNLSSNSAVLCISVITVNLFGKPVVEKQQDEQKYRVRPKEHNLRTSLSDEQHRGGKDGGCF